MFAFVNASGEQKQASEPEETAEDRPEASLKAQKRALQQEELELRAERRVVRQQRKVKDEAWEKAKKERGEEKEKLADRTPQERKSADGQWRSIAKKRREARKRRKEEDKEWREKRNRIRERKSALPIVTAWIAVLVIIDSCTRQCLGLPLFVVGSKVTAEMIVAALRELLPPELQFLISDRGTHFTANVFRELARSEEFIHVLTARHRPESNGIAERFVRTLKEWLRDKSWDDDQQLDALLAEFRVEYDDRPHQGLPIPGLSPNEYARRICSTSS
jgi:transposase InsO family protein